MTAESDPTRPPSFNPTTFESLPVTEQVDMLRTQAAATATTLVEEAEAAALYPRRIGEGASDPVWERVTAKAAIAFPRSPATVKALAITARATEPGPDMYSGRETAWTAAWEQTSRILSDDSFRARQAASVPDPQEHDWQDSRDALDALAEGDTELDHLDRVWRLGADGLHHVPSRTTFLARMACQMAGAGHEIPADLSQHLDPTTSEKILVAQARHFLEQDVPYIDAAGELADEVTDEADAALLETMIARALGPDPANWVDVVEGLRRPHAWNPQVRLEIVKVLADARQWGLARELAATIPFKAYTGRPEYGTAAYIALARAMTEAIPPAERQQEGKDPIDVLRELGSLHLHQYQAAVDEVRTTPQLDPTLIQHAVEAKEFAAIEEDRIKAVTDPERARQLAATLAIGELPQQRSPAPHVVHAPWRYAYAAEHLVPVLVGLGYAREMVDFALQLPDASERSRTLTRIGRALQAAHAAEGAGGVALPQAVTTPTPPPAAS